MALDLRHDLDDTGILGRPFSHLYHYVTNTEPILDLSICCLCESEKCAGLSCVQQLSEHAAKFKGLPC